MQNLYEFRVAGTIGPVILSALPELTACAAEHCCVLAGSADDPQQIDQLLRRLEELSILETEIHIRRVNRAHTGGDTAAGGDESR